MITKLPLFSLFFYLVFVSATSAQTNPKPFATAADAGTAPYNAAPGALASVNTSAIQAALNAAAPAGGLVTLSNCGTYSVNAPLVISSNTRLLLAPCVTLQQAAGNAPNNMIVNHAYTQRGSLGGTITYSTGVGTTCTPNTTQFVTFTAGNGGGYSGYGQIAINGSGSPNGSVTILNPGAWYSTPPTTGTISSCSGTANFGGGSITGSLPSLTLTNGYSITSVANHSGSNTTYTGNIGVGQCPPVGGPGGVSMSGFAQSANNGLFTLVSCTPGTPGTLVVNNGSGISDTTGTASLGTEVVVTWTAHGFTAGLSWAAIWGFNLVSSPSTSGFAGVFQVESVIDANHFTYRMLRLPTSAPGGTVVGMVPDTNITIEGGTFDYNGPNLTAPGGYPVGYPTGYNVGDPIITFAAQNVEIRNTIIENASQNAIYDAMVRDFYVSRATDNGYVSQQFIKSIGPAFNAKVEKITSFGADDTVTWMSDDEAYLSGGGGFPQVGLSRGDVINAGCEHIDRALTYSAASGICDFFSGVTAYMGGVYAKNITGTMPLGGASTGSGCVDFSFNGVGAFLDTALVENINCNATWSVHVGSGTGQAYKFNGIDIHGITCNQSDANGGQLGEVCVGMDSFGIGQRMSVDGMTVGFQGNTFGGSYISISGALSELNITNTTLNSNGAGSPSCTGSSFPTQIVNLASGANVAKLNVDKAVQPCGNAAVQISSGAGAITYPLTAASNHTMGGITTYTGTFSPIITSGVYVTISGFVNPGNNGTFLVDGNSTATSLFVDNGGGVAEPHSATAITATNVTISNSIINAVSAIITFASANITLKDNLLSNNSSPIYLPTPGTIALNVQTQGNSIAGGNGNWLCLGGGADCNHGSGNPIINWDDRGNLTPNMGYPPAVAFGAGGDTCLFATFPSISGFGGATLTTGSNNCGFVITTSGSPSGSTGTFTFPVTARTGWYCTFNLSAAGSIEWTSSTSTTWNGTYLNASGMPVTWPANASIAFSCHPR